MSKLPEHLRYRKGKYCLSLFYNLGYGTECFAVGHEYYYTPKEIIMRIEELNNSKDKPDDICISTPNPKPKYYKTIEAFKESLTKEDFE